MNKQLAIIAFATFILLSSIALAGSLAGINYPIKELGNCKNQEDCKAYCDDNNNSKECDAFVEKYGLDEKLAKISALEFPIAVLGNCGSRPECAEYCKKLENAVACLSFAEQSSIIEKTVVEEDKKMAELAATGKTPGNCATEAECITYCENDAHFFECLAFVEGNKIMPEKDIGMIKKFGSFNINGPGGCKSKSDCKEYCKADAHFSECLDFLEKNQVIPAQEVSNLKKIGSFTGPGGCIMDECENYCEKEENFSACIEFGHSHGMMSDEEYEMAKKTGGKGPGNCKGKDACDAYCNDAAHAEDCINFGCQNGLMPEADCKQMRQMLSRGINPMAGGPGGCKGKDACDAFCNDSANAQACIDFSCKAGFMSEQECANARQMIAKGINPMAGGPGGCKGREACDAFCNNPANASECLEYSCKAGFRAEQDCERGRRMIARGMNPNFGPGGCQGKEECDAFCQSHMEECFNFGCQSGETSPEDCAKGFMGRNMPGGGQQGGQQMPPQILGPEQPQPQMPEPGQPPTGPEAPQTPPPEIPSPEQPALEMPVPQEPVPPAIEQPVQQPTEPAPEQPPA